MKNPHNWRYNLVGALLFILPVLIVLQMLRIKINPQQVDKLISEGKSFSGEYRTLTPARGRIYDRWGHLLAGNRTAYEVGIELRKVKNPATIAQTLNMVLGIDYAEALGAASMSATDTAVYRVVASNVEPEKIDQLKALINQMDSLYGTSREKDAPSLNGLMFEPHLKRTYPDNELASNILGFVTIEGVGFYGIEEKYNDLLAGEESIVWVSLDPIRVKEMPEIQKGADIVLTIDRAIQRSMERVIDRAIDEHGAESGTLVVIDPKTGEFAGGFEEQAEQAMDNLKAILEEAGFSMADVVQCQVFVSDLNNYPVFNGIYAKYFEKDYPARAFLEVARIPKDGLIEIMMVAAKS